VPAEEERKLVTILFADLVGSTALASDEDPERVRVRLERFYDAMTEEIERTGGTVEKFAGDAVMAVYGAPAALEDHAERALHAALAMQRRLQELFRGELELRIGVNTGDAVVGEPREGSSFVAGDVVNVTARLEQVAEPGEVLCGERTVAAARGAFEFGERRIVEAKGKPDGIACHTVVRDLSLMRPRGVGGLRRVFVSRESELELLRALFRRTVDQGEAHLVTSSASPSVSTWRGIFTRSKRGRLCTKPSSSSSRSSGQSGRWRCSSRTCIGPRTISSTCSSGSPGTRRPCTRPRDDTARAARPTSGVGSRSP
jgi:class 3 adenylate cyclase